MARVGNDGAFQRALARFKTNLTSDEQENFSVTSLEDVQKTIVRIQNTQGSQGKMRNLTRVKAFLEAMEQYGKVVETFLNASNFLAFIWGPIKFLLQVASTWVDSFDVLLEAYEEISENIPQLLEYGEVFRRHPHMRKSLELIYGDILEFHRRALRFFTRPTWKQLFHSSWKTFRTQFQYILNSLSRHKTLIESQASIVEYGQSEIAREAARSHFDEIAKAETLRRSLAVTEKIHPPNSRIDQDKAKEARQENRESGKWILRHDLLRDWMDLSCHNVRPLWVNGIPGAGKTVIASLIIEETEAIDSVNVGFFYCKYGDNQKNCFIRILGGILAQLVKQNEELLSYMYDACCSSNEAIIESESLLKRLVEVSLRSCGTSTCIIIDGIDECEEAEERKTIAWFLEMYRNIAKDNAGTIRLLFISQRDRVTENLLDKASVITLDSTYHQEDIQVYARHWSMQFQRKFGIAKTLASQISINVATQAQGLFLFAKLVLAYLYTQTTQEKLFKELEPNSFPTGLEAAYERIALRVFENPILSEREDAHNIFRWIACARRPLKWSDIQSIFAIDPTLSRVDFDKRQLRVTCRDLCGSLVEASAEGTLEIVHKSAKQYLIKSGRISIGSEELHIAEFCLDYLTFRCFDADLTKSNIRAFIQERYYSFEDYAIRYWLGHLETSTAYPLLLETSSLQHLGQKIQSFFTKHGSGSPPDSSVADVQTFQHIRQWPFTQRLDTLAQLAREHKSNKSYLDLETQLQRRRRIYEDIITDPNSDEALLESLRLNGSGCYKCPKIWCGYFADGFQRKEDREKHIGQHERPFRCSFDECLHAELGFESEKAFKRHEKTSHRNGQDSEWVFPTKKPRKPLDIFSASAKGDLDTVERLVGEGVEINKTTKPKGSITAISLAVKHGHPQIVSYLIGQGCKPPPLDVFGTATRQNSIDILRMLFEMEAEPGTMNALAQHTLNIAARNGLEEVVHLLLTYGIDINERYVTTSTTALEEARRYGHDNIVQILLDNGAQLVPQQQLPSTSIPEFNELNALDANVDNSYVANFDHDFTNTDILEGFDFDQFLQTDGDFNFDPPVTFENPEDNGVPASNLPAVQGHAQAQAQAEAQQQTSQQEKQQQQAASQQQQQHQSAQENAQQQTAQMQFALQQASQAASTQGPPSPLPSMIVQSQVPPVPDPTAAANAARQQQQQQQQQQEQQEQQEAPTRQPRDSEADLLLNSEWL